MQSIYDAFQTETTTVTETSNNETRVPQLPPPAPILTPHQIAEWRWANVDNLDLFLQRVYDYFNNRGFYCIILQRAIKMATVAFVVWFSTYIYSCIDYTKLKNAPSFGYATRHHCTAHISWMHLLSLYLFSALWCLKLFLYISDIKNLWEIHEFYTHLLHISENELQTISWQQVVNRIENSKSINGALATKIDVHQVVHRIMRKENYMIALYNQNILNLKLTWFKNTEFLSKILEWTIFLCLDDYIFNENNQLRSTIFKESKRDQLAAGLRRRFQFAAIVNVLLAPLVVVYMVLYYFFKYFNEYYSSPKNLGSRQYTPLAEWRFREFNELYHLFKKRISMSELPATRYIQQFPRFKTELLLKFVIFVLGSFAAVLLALSVYDHELLNLELKVYLSFMGIAIVIARAMLPEPSSQAIYDPETSMRQIIEFTHYMPDRWEGKLHKESTKTEFCSLYDLKPKIILREILGVIVNPFILFYNLANRSEFIIDFFRLNSTKITGLSGHVCSLAVFNTDKIDKVKQQSDDLDEFYLTQDGKVLKSYLNFMDVYGKRSHRGSYSRPASAQPIAPAQPIASASSTAPAVSPAGARTKYTTSFPDSVMHTYSNLKDLNSQTSSISEHSDDELAKDGVIGLLNNLYKK